MNNTKLFKLEVIDLEASPHVRAELNESAIADYAKQYKDKQPMPDCVLFLPPGGNPLMVADGRHRIEAMKRAGLKGALFTVLTGTYEDCLRYALKANSAHGVQRTNADKRAGIKLALTTFPKQSNGNVAEICDVGDDLVAIVRKEMEANGHIPEAVKRVGKDGKTRAVQPSETRVESKQTPKIIGKSEDSKTAEPAVAAPKSKPEPKVVTDEIGYPIPDKILPMWERRQEIQDLLTAISKVRSTIEKAAKEDDRIYTAELKCNPLLTDISRVYTQIDRAKPAVVCTSCQGQFAERCTACKGRGFISKFYYDTIVDVKLKKVREAAIKGKK